MQSYLVERELLEKVVDDIIKRSIANGRADLLAAREKLISDLDQRINDAIFDDLSDEQSVKINQLLSDENTSEEMFKKFFDENQIDLEQVIGKTIEQFANDMLRSNHAE